MLLRILRYSLFVAVTGSLIGCGAPSGAKKSQSPQSEPAPARKVTVEDEAGAYFGQGQLARAEGNTEDALAYFLEAARLYKSTGKTMIEEADARNEAASVAVERLERELAVEEYDLAVKIYLRFKGNSKAKAAVALNNMGTVYKQMAQEGRARDCWVRALKIYRSLPPEHQSTRNMARIEQNIRDMDQGLY